MPKLRLTRKQYQLLLVFAFFAFVAMFATGIFIPASVIQGETAVVGAFTIDDGLRFFGLFGTCATLAFLFAQYKKR